MRSISNDRPMNKHLALAVAFLVAFLVASAAGAETVRAPRKLTPAQLAACKAKGGRPEMVLYYVESCVWPTSDVGRTCRDGSDCQGFCEAPRGTEVDASALDDAQGKQRTGPAAVSISLSAAGPQETCVFTRYRRPFARPGPAGHFYVWVLSSLGMWAAWVWINRVPVSFRS